MTRMQQIFADFSEDRLADGLDTAHFGDLLKWQQEC
jgi:hypothetical protein